MNKATQEVEKIISELDFDNLGQIDYTRNIIPRFVLNKSLEFIIASMNQDKILSSTKIQQAFKIFDIVRNSKNN